ncbi:MAG TPA: glycoside hydrolase family 3 N-terminal domain-containing protein [Gemmatimonadaceae bacterium]|nr:glycoside hydrolase family 3 N-terminal domain-containing protein [Gemmatimonadaceae bacterium]
MARRQVTINGLTMHLSQLRRRGAIVTVALIAPLTVAHAQRSMRAQPTLGSRSAPIIERGGLRFRDLDRNGALDPYEDWRLTPAERARDLVGRMTLEEKAGAMMHGTARSGGPMGAAGVGTAYDSAANVALIGGASVTSMITRLGGDPSSLANQDNALQAVAERTRLGIPVTISTDPRHHFQYVLGASVTTGKFSQWPEALGFAAIGDAALVRRFGDIARQEYRAVGIHMALSPQADLSTEPRWARINGTFGEDAALAGRLVRAYVEGFQHGTRGVDSAGVLTVVKHWVGYGAAKNGLDSHNSYGSRASFSGANLEYHVRPFLGALAANVAGVMPTYSVLEGATWKGKPIEQVGAAFNKQLLTDMLRGQYGYRGMVITDWGVTNDCNERCQSGAPAGERPSFADVGMPWGVETLPKRERFVKAVRAGVDQFGGTEDARTLVDAVRAGELTEGRLDESVRRVMTQKFALGLFENPYVDMLMAARRVGTQAMRDAGLDAQRRSLVLLENDARILPLKATGKSGALRVYVAGIDSAAVKRAGWTVVSDPAQADVALMRLVAPYETLHPAYVFGAMQHEGSLAFPEGNEAYAELRRVSAIVPTVVTVYLDRPAILTPLKGRARAIVANFGVSDDALLDVLAGRAKPMGKLPFDLPTSADDVAAQKSDVAHDLAHPLYRFGFGLSY